MLVSAVSRSRRVFIILVHTVQALHRNDEVVIDLLDFRIMLLKVCQQTELAVQRSGVGLQVELDFFTGLCVFLLQVLRGG